jgi:LmbE family N-acetylglucosaminyl deacetylase
MSDKYYPPQKKEQLNKITPIVLPHYSFENDDLMFMNFRKKKIDNRTKQILKLINGIDPLYDILLKHPQFNIEEFYQLEENGFIVLYKLKQVTDKVRNKMMILSPHADDAIFSLAGLMTKHSNHFEFHIINIFGRQDFTLYNDFANNKIGSDFVHKEEKLAWLLLNIQNGTFLSFKDAAMRQFDPGRPIINSDLDSKSMITYEKELFEDIFSHINELIGAIRPSYIFCPLGIGRHVDHIMVREAVLANQDLDKKLYFYEESPYVISFDKTKEINEIERKSQKKLKQRQINITNKISEKRKLLNLYASQLKKFQINAMINHAQANDQHYYENYWKFE